MEIENFDLPYTITEKAIPVSNNAESSNPFPSSATSNKQEPIFGGTGGTTTNWGAADNVEVPF